MKEETSEIFFHLSDIPASFGVNFAEMKAELALVIIKCDEMHLQDLS